jgi:hypothetical protein
MNKNCIRLWIKLSTGYPQNNSKGCPQTTLIKKILIINQLKQLLNISTGLIITINYNLYILFNKTGGGQLQFMTLTAKIPLSVLGRAL